MTRFELHVKTWKECKQCSLHETRKNVVLCRGQIPCQVLFIGEAPGESEDTLGVPFIGPSGHLLNRIVSESLPKDISRAFTNLIGCIPRDHRGSKAKEPDQESIEACKPRLEDLIKIAQPKLIVCVGVFAKDYLNRGYKHTVRYDPKIKTVEIAHPASILRSSIINQELMMQRCIIRISDAVEELTNDK